MFFYETYVPIARLEVLRLLLAYACMSDFKPFHIDVKSVVLILLMTLYLMKST